MTIRKRKSSHKHSLISRSFPLEDREENRSRGPASGEAGGDSPRSDRFCGHRASEHAQARGPWSRPNPGKRGFGLGCLARSSSSGHPLKASAPKLCLLSPSLDMAPFLPTCIGNPIRDAHTSVPHPELSPELHIQVHSTLCWMCPCGRSQTPSDQSLPKWGSLSSPTNLSHFSFTPITFT